MSRTTTGDALSLHIDKAQERALYRTLRSAPRRIPIAVARAVNRTAKPTGIKLVADAVGKVLTLKKTSIKSRIKQTRRATPNDTSTEIAIRSPRRPLVTSFTGTRRVKGGVLWKGRQGGEREVIETGWIVNKSSRGGARVPITRYAKVASRIPYKGPRGGKYRELRGITVAGVLDGRPGLAKEVIDDMGGVLEKRTAESIEFELLKLSRAK